MFVSMLQGKLDGNETMLFPVAGNDIHEIPNGTLVEVNINLQPTNNDLIVYTYNDILYLRRFIDNKLVNDKNEPPHPTNENFQFIGTAVATAIKLR